MPFIVMILHNSSVATNAPLSGMHQAHQGELGKCPLNPSAKRCPSHMQKPPNSHGILDARHEGVLGVASGHQSQRLLAWLVAGEEGAWIGRGQDER